MLSILQKINKFRGLCSKFLWIQHFINKAVLDSLFGTKVIHTLCILFNLFHILSTSFCEKFVCGSTIIQNLLRLNSNIASLTLRSRARLIQQNRGIGKSKSISFLS